MGSEKRTVQNLRIVKVIADKNLLLVKGAIPGANGDDVIVRTAIKGQWALPTPPVVAPAEAKKGGAKPAAPAKPAAAAKK
jgi:large subunit ribosomal protein L3